MKSIDTDGVICYTFPREGIDRSCDHVSVVGRQVVKPGETYPHKGFPQEALFADARGRCIDQFQLVLVNKGGGVFIDRGVEYSVSEGSVLLIRPGFWHSYAPDSATGWTEYFVGFNGDTFSRIILGSISKEGSVYNLPDAHRNTFIKMLQYAGKPGEDTQIILTSMLFMILSGIVYGQATSPNGGKKSASLIVKVRDYLERNIDKQFNLQNIAPEMGVSYTAFNTIFKEQTGMSPVRYLGKMRLQRAKYKLLKTDLSIKAIASDCGFSSTEYFCGFFRKETGMSPSEFRNNKSTRNL